MVLDFSFSAVELDFPRFADEEVELDWGPLSFEVLFDDGDDVALLSMVIFVEVVLDFPEVSLPAEDVCPLFVEVSLLGDDVLFDFPSSIEV